MKFGANDALQYVYTACALFVLAVCDFEHTCTPERLAGPPHPQGSCGPVLDEVVRTVCSFPFRMKRGLPDFVDSDKTRRLLDPDSDASSYLNLVSKYQKKRVGNQEAFGSDSSVALQFLRSRRGRFGSQNIVCECCYHKCTMTEWRQYC